MELSLSTRQLLNSMPDLSFGEDQNDFVRRCLQWNVDHGYSNMEVVDAARMKWKKWEIENLLARIDAGDDAALRRGVVLLLKDRFIP